VIESAPVVNSWRTKLTSYAANSSSSSWVVVSGAGDMIERKIPRRSSHKNGDRSGKLVAFFSRDRF